MIIADIDEDDLAICVDYVVEEYSKLDTNTKGIALRMEHAIEGKNGWKVLDGDTIAGFAAVEEFGGTLLITSLVVGERYRTSKATWMLFKRVLEEAGTRALVYIPIHPQMWAGKLCKDGRIDKSRAKEWVDKLAKRWE